MTLIEDRTVRAYDFWCLALDQTNLDERIELLEKSTELDAYRPNVWHALAQSYFKAERFEDCERAINLGLLVDERDTFLLKDKMILEMDKGDMQAALDTINRLPAEGKDIEALVKLKISILVDAHRWEEALAEAENMVNWHRPKMGDLLILGHLADQLGRQDIALKAFSRLKQMHPKRKDILDAIEDYELRHPENN